MAFQAPTADELKKIARANHIELTEGELDALQRMTRGQMAILEKIDALTLAPQESVTRYRDRKAGVRPSPKDDPLNAIVTRCSVKGGASGPLKGKRVGVKDSVCVAGIPASGGSSVLKRTRRRERRDHRCADARRRRGNRRDLEHGRFRAVRRRPHQLLRSVAQSAQP